MLCSHRHINAAAFVAALLCVVALLASSASYAQASDDWTFQGIIYGYLPSIDGKTTFPEEGEARVTIDASKFLENLEFVFMGSFEASKGSWGVFTDAMYLDVGDSNSPSRDITIGGGMLPAGASANIHYGLRAWTWSLAATWRVQATPTSRLDVIAGTRMIELDQEVDWQLSGNIGSIALRDRAGTSKTGVTNWDAIVGIKGRAGLGEGHWVVPYYFDVGAGDSQFTWQAMAGLGYTFRWGELMGLWRYIDYDMKSDKEIASASLNGPAIAVAFRW
jgi:hypothetical protein